MSTRAGEACPIWIALMVTLQAAASTAVLSGCEPTQERIQTKATAPVLEEATDPLQLQLDIARFVDRAYVRVTAAAGDIAAQTQQRRVREATVRLRIRALRMSHDAFGQPDPRRAFLINWIGTVRFRLSLQEEERNPLSPILNGSLLNQSSSMLSKGNTTGNWNDNGFFQTSRQRKRAPI